MTLCKPCHDRGRTREATRTVTGEPWCQICFEGETPRQVVVPKPAVGTCKSCPRRITARSRSGYCTACSKREWNRQRDRQRRTHRFPCRKQGCPGRVTRQSKSGYCTYCLQTDTKLRAQLYPSQSPERCKARAIKAIKAQRLAARVGPISTYSTQEVLHAS